MSLIAEGHLNTVWKVAKAFVDLALQYTVKHFVLQALKDHDIDKKLGDIRLTFFKELNALLLRHTNLNPVFFDACVDSELLSKQTKIRADRTTD